MFSLIGDTTPRLHVGQLETPRHPHQLCAGTGCEMFLALCYCCHDVTLVDAKTRFARCLGGRWGFKSDSYFLVHMPRGKKLLANRMPPRSPSLCAFEEMQTPFGCVLRSVCRVCVAHQGPRLGPIFLARAARFHRPESGRDPCSRACKTVCYGLSSRNFLISWGLASTNLRETYPSPSLLHYPLSLLGLWHGVNAVCHIDALILASSQNHSWRKFRRIGA